MCTEPNRIRGNLVTGIPQWEPRTPEEKLILYETFAVSITRSLPDPIGCSGMDEGLYALLLKCEFGDRLKTMENSLDLLIGDEVLVYGVSVNEALGSGVPFERMPREERVYKLSGHYASLVARLPDIGFEI